jgi:hypothetical protein
MNGDISGVSAWKERMDPHEAYKTYVHKKTYLIHFGDSLVNPLI